MRIRKRKNGFSAKGYKKEEIINLIELEKNIKRLDEDIFGEGKKKYKLIVSVQKPFEQELKKWKLNNNICFEIRPREDNHWIPHFHIEIKGGHSGSYRIDDFNRLVGNFTNAEENKILDWARENQALLKEIWNQYHGKRIRVE